MEITLRSGRDLIKRTNKNNKEVDVQLLPQSVKNKQTKVDYVEKICGSLTRQKLRF